MLKFLNCYCRGDTYTHKEIHIERGTYIGCDTHRVRDTQREAYRDIVRVGFLTATFMYFSALGF